MGKVYLSHDDIKKYGDPKDNDGKNISPYHVPYLDKQNKYENTYDGWDKDSLSLMLLWHIFGVFSGESPEINKKSHLFSIYIENALDRLDKGEDSGIFPSIFIDLWENIQQEDKDYIEEKLFSVSDNIKDFPSFSSLNIISTLENVTLELFDEYQYDSFIPLIVETKKGIAGIAPVFSSEEEISLALLKNSQQSYGLNVETFHAWNLRDKKIIKINSSSEDAENYILDSILND